MLGFCKSGHKCQYLQLLQILKPGACQHGFWKLLLSVKLVCMCLCVDRQAINNKYSREMKLYLQNIKAFSFLMHRYIGLEIKEGAVRLVELIRVCCCA